MARSVIVSLLVGFGIVASAMGWAKEPGPANGREAATAASVPAVGKVTFLELGSVGCIPCEQMKPVMQAVRDKYGRRVEVTFHDVKADRAVARQWSIRLIPTQIFLDAEGKEVFRHEGFLALNEVLKVLHKMGVD